MKKIITCLICAFMAVTAICFTACDSGKTADVNLVAVSAGDVGRLDSCDYFVVPEPAASTKVNAVKKLKFAGNLQTLYGGEDGYPQALIVAKCSLLETDFVAKFLEEVKTNDEWLLSESTSALTIASAVQSHLTSGLTPAFNAANLTKSVIQNCGINLTYSYNDKEQLISFMQQFNEVSETSFGIPDDNFFQGEVYPEAEYSGTVKVYAPDGAPALGLAKLMSENWTINNMEMQYNVVDALTIQSFVTGENPQADICVIPVNLAVKLLGTGAKYRAVATLTHGNLFILKNGEQQDITAQNIASLNGKMVGVVNLAQVPGLTFKTILKKYNLSYTELV